MRIFRVTRKMTNRITEEDLIKRISHIVKVENLDSTYLDLIISVISNEDTSVMTFNNGIARLERNKIATSRDLDNDIIELLRMRKQKLDHTNEAINQIKEFLDSIPIVTAIQLTTVRHCKRMKTVNLKSRNREIKPIKIKLATPQGYHIRRIYLVSSIRRIIDDKFIDAVLNYKFDCDNYMFIPIQYEKIHQTVVFDPCKIDRDSDRISKITEFYSPTASLKYVHQTRKELERYLFEQAEYIIK